MEKVNKLEKNEAFLDIESDELAKFAPIFSAIDLDEFFLHCNLNPTLKYSRAVYRACRQATMYILYGISHKLRMGKYMMSELKVVDGFVGNTPHTWLQLGNDFYLDMTLAQFTTYPIPKIAILPIDKAGDIYRIQYVIPWNEWVQLEAKDL